MTGEFEGITDYARKIVRTPGFSSGDQHAAFAIAQWKAGLTPEYRESSENALIWRFLLDTAAGERRAAAGQLHIRSGSGPVGAPRPPSADTGSAAPVSVQVSGSQSDGYVLPRPHPGLEVLAGLVIESDFLSTQTGSDAHRRHGAEDEGTRPATVHPEPQDIAPAGPDSLSDQGAIVAHIPSVAEGQDSPQAIPPAASIPGSPAGTDDLATVTPLPKQVQQDSSKVAAYHRMFPELSDMGYVGGSRTKRVGAFLPSDSGYRAEQYARQARGREASAAGEEQLIETRERLNAQSRVKAAAWNAEAAFAHAEHARWQAIRDAQEALGNCTVEELPAGELERLGFHRRAS